MTSVKRLAYKSYAGPRIAGSVPFRLSPTPSHLEKALWLTSSVESGAKFGSICMYDGTAMTAGLHQAIAVYPKELVSEDYNAEDDQGSLWKLLRLLETVQNLPEYNEVSRMLKECGWYLAQDGVLRYLDDGKSKVGPRTLRYSAGDTVYGAHIREEFTPKGGAVPSSGKNWLKAKAWALAFHKLFSAEPSFLPQIQFGVDHISVLAKTRRLHEASVEAEAYDGRITDFVPSSSAYDLAMSVFWSHSVNAPSVAFKVLRSSGDVKSPEFPLKLLRFLGTMSYGRWHFTDSGGRYQRTRKWAMEVWPEDLFLPGGIMPLSF